MQRRAADHRLDPSLREACASDIEDVCGYEKVRVYQLAHLEGPALRLRLLSCPACFYAPLVSLQSGTVWDISERRVKVKGARADPAAAPALVDMYSGPQKHVPTFHHVLLEAT